MSNKEGAGLMTNLNRLVWLDMEMTGLRPDQDRILEVAMIVTDANLLVIEESPSIVLHQSDEILSGMDQWNTSMHGRSGLIDKVRASTLDEAQAEALLLSFLEKHLAPSVSPMCGSTICQDRRFMARWMPRLEAYFHYRNLDVSTIKELVKRWRPQLLKKMVKESRHEALMDVRESIEELRFYRTHFLRWSEDDTVQPA